MRIPEAIEALDTIRRLSPGTDVWRREVTRILDDVWLTAYNEGKDRVFEPPPAEVPGLPDVEYHGKHAIHNHAKYTG